MHIFFSRPRFGGSSLGLLTLGLLALLPRPASAQVTSYTTLSGFQAASAGLNDPFYFDGYAPFGQANYGHNAGFDGISFTSGALLVLSPDSGYGDAFGGHQYLKGSAGQNLYMNTAPGTTAFGADWSGLGSGPIQISVNGQSFSFAEGTQFAGFTSADPITNIVFSGGKAGPALDGITYGAALPNGGPSPVPEASPALSLGLLLALGLGGAAFAAHKKARADA